MKESNIVISKVKQIKQAILNANLVEPDTLTGHDFMGGCYVRTLTAPAGSLLVGKIHKHKSINILLSGTIYAVENDGEPRMIEAPSIWESEANVAKAFYVEKDMIFTNIHPTKSTNLKYIERKFIEEEV